MSFALKLWCFGAVLACVAAMNLAPNSFHPDVLRALQEQRQRVFASAPPPSVHPNCASQCGDRIVRAAVGCKNHRTASDCQALCSDDGLKEFEGCIGCLANVDEGNGLDRFNARSDLDKARTMHVFLVVCERSGYDLPAGYDTSIKYDLPDDLYGPIAPTFALPTSESDVPNVVDPRWVIGMTVVMGAVALGFVWNSL